MIFVGQLQVFPLHSNLLHPTAEAKFIHIIPTLTITTKQMLQHMLGRIFLSPLERRNTSEKGRPCHSPPRKLLFGCCEALAPLKEQTGADSNYCNQRFLNIWDKILAIKVRFFFFFSVLYGEIFFSCFVCTLPSAGVMNSKLPSMHQIRGVFCI